MRIDLHPDIEKFIGEQVRVGKYRTPDEVVTEALFLLWQRQEEQADKAAPDGHQFPTEPSLTPSEPLSVRWLTG